MKRHLFSRRGSGTGFTLVELLVSISVLSLMLIGLATMMGVVTKTWLAGINSVDNFTKARVVLNLLDRDIQMMVMRRDLGAFVNSSGGSACAFYTNVQGNPGTGLTVPDTRTVSLVQYLLNTAATAPTLQRINYGANFLSTTGVTPTIGTTGSLSAPANSTEGTDNVFTGIIRFQIQFIDGSGTILTPPYALTSTPPSSSTVPTLPTPFWFDYSNPGGSYNPRIVVVSMLVLSSSAYKVATQGTGAFINTLANDTTDFPTTAPTNQTYSQVWNAALNSPSATFLALPAPLRGRGAIQVFERHIPLPITPPSS